MNLVIVESPTKAKTISKYLNNSFKVIASVGHIRDLPKNNKRAIDIPAGFVPHYEIVKGKEKLVRELKKISKRASEIYLATDPDREGEAIAWHITQAIGLGNSKSETLNSKKIKRIVFHEITEQAIKEALAHPRGIDEHLLKAQEARRVLDRLFGYDLSGLIWRKVRYGLSAGRVQSPALRILVEREREIQAFVSEKFWTIEAKLETNEGVKFDAICEKEPRDFEEVRKIIEAARGGNWHIVKIKQTEIKRSPRPPFITSSLQQSASSRLGFSPSRTMTIAQKLYEEGLITYMRTDSFNLSKEAQSEIHSLIERDYGKEYLLPRQYLTRSKSAQEAHEAIRPTKISKKEGGHGDDQKKLYKLIWERTVSSQMSDAKILRTSIISNVENSAIPNFVTAGSVIVFPGWLQADPRSRGEEKELPKLSENTPIKLDSIEALEKETEPPPRYTEAGLIKELEKREIGRPSTYATIISTLEKRGYVEKLGRSLKPTDTGEVVSSFLEANFGKYISDNFTAEMENDLDEIAEGKRDYKKTLEDFYKPFSKDVKAKEKMEKITTLGKAPPHLKCPVCSSGMVVKLGRSGKFLSCKNFPQCKGALRMDGTAIEAPKETGELCPECKTGKLIERDGRYGKFVACSNYPKCKYVRNSENGENGNNGTGVRCPEDGGEIVGRRGRFGPFYSCANYPKCKFIMKSRPTGNKCSLCGSLMMEGTKTIPERCSNKTCSNHNPHKK